MLAQKDALSEEEAGAIEFVFKEIRSSLDPEIIRLSPENNIRSDEEVSLAEHRATRPLFVEYLTYHGEEIRGAKPFERS